MLNEIKIIGNVGKDPEVKEVNDNKVAKFTIATSETYKNKSGEKKTNVEWHNIAIWGALAGVVEKYIKKGSKLYISGKITYREYEKDGHKKHFTEIVGRNLIMLDSKKDSDQTKPSQTNNTSPANNPPQTNTTPEFDDVDDLPF